MTAKVRKTLTLDPDVVEAFGGDDQALSTTVNDILRAERDRRERRAALSAFVDELSAEFGAPDPDEVNRFRQLLS